MAQALSDKQLTDISRLIEDHHTAFMINVVGLESLVDPADVARLKRKGLITKSAKNFPQDTFLFGFLSDALKETGSKTMSYKAFKHYLKSRPLPITEEERGAIKHLKRSLVTHLKGLGNTVDKRTQQIIVEGDQALRRRLMQQVKHELVSGYEKRKAIGEVTDALRKATKDYARNWYRIASTELNNAYQEGKFQFISKANKGRDPLVFKRPRPDCCEECTDAYLTRKGIPRIFRLSELTGNGSNVGRGRDLRKAVIGSHHPWCFPAGAPVLTDRGQVAIENVQVGDRVLTHTGRWQRVMQTHENQWSGRLVDVLGTFATPSHPYLTQRGWVPSEALQSSDHLIDTSEQIARLEAEQSPTFFSKEGLFDRILASLTLGLMPTPAVNFHGEFVLEGAEVDVEAFDSEEGSQRQRRCSECGREGFFEVGETLSLLHGSGFLNKLRNGSDASSPSSVGSGYSMLSPYGGELGVHSGVSLARIAPPNAVFSHTGTNRVSVAAQHPGDFENGPLLRVMQTMQEFFRKLLLPSGHGDRPPYRSYAHAPRKYFSGHVFNLSVWGDESYLVNGVVTHNCRCELHEIPDGFEFDSKGNLTYVGF